MKTASLFFVIVFVAASGPPASAQTLADVPGTVVYSRSSPFTRFIGNNRIYTTSPSIVRLPDGDYLLSFNLFGASLDPPASESGTTLIFHSSDKGASWNEVPSSPVMDMKRGSLFVHEGDVYLWGYQSNSGRPRILKSMDQGQTWSEPVELHSSRRGGTPMNPARWTDENGVPRLWFSLGGRRMMSARADADLLDPENWSAVGNDAGLGQLPDFPSGEWKIISEAQIVASPETGVVVMPKVQFENVTRPYFSGSILFRREPDTDRELLPAGPGDWVDLPGADKKFGAGYDAVSGKFYIVSNPVLPAHYGHKEPWNMIRNTAALISSADLVHWDVEQLFLYSPNTGYEAFQYLNFDIDGEDMIIASRTAFDITGEPGVMFKPPRGHDSNLVTFHRIPDFRQATADQYLEIRDGVVRRYERTQHAVAPLGDFVLGADFQGKSLGPVDGLASGEDGEVLVRAKSGRILRFDLLGNFLGPGPAAGVTWQDRLDVAQPPRQERGWILNGSGDWDSLHNWFYWNRADTGLETANFGSAIESAATVTLNRQRRIRGLRFRNPHSYSITGNGSLVLVMDKDAARGESPGPAHMDIVEGSHSIAVPVELGGDAQIQVHSGAQLQLAGGLDVAGHTLQIGGGGTVNLGGVLSLNGGTLLLVENNGPPLRTGGTLRLNGTLEWRPEKNLRLQAGDTFLLLPDVAHARIEGSFDKLLLPQLSPGLRWNTENLYTEGKVTVSAPQEPAGALPGEEL